MLDRSMPFDHGPELFFEFVPGTVRPFSDPLGVPILSSAVLAELSSALQDPVIEVTWPGPTVLSGALRAAKHADAILAVSMPASRPGEAGDRQVDDAHVGLTQNMGGSGASSVVHIFERV